MTYLSKTIEIWEMEIWKKEILKNGNLEKWKFGKMEL